MADKLMGDPLVLCVDEKGRPKVRIVDDGESCRLLATFQLLYPENA